MSLLRREVSAMWINEAYDDFVTALYRKSDRSCTTYLFQIVCGVDE